MNSVFISILGVYQDVISEGQYKLV